MNKLQQWADKQAELIKDNLGNDFDPVLKSIAVETPYIIINDKNLVKLSKELNEAYYNIITSFGYDNKIKLQKVYNKLHEKVESRLKKIGLDKFSMGLVESLGYTFE